MRALILILSLAVATLAVLILLAKPETLRVGPEFETSRLISDAAAGEWARYRDERGDTLTYRVEGVIPGGGDRPPLVRIGVSRQDQRGNILPGGQAVYDHRPTRHGLFPLAAPEDPRGLDRVWVWTRIRRMSLTWQGKGREAWRVDLLDPALPAEGGDDHVVAWFDESIPVFGLLLFQRWGHTWTLQDWGPR